MSGTDHCVRTVPHGRSKVEVDVLIAALFWCYLLLLPFAHWLAPSGWLPLPNIPLLAVAALLPFSTHARIEIVWRDVVLLALAVLGVISTLLNVETLTSKSVNHMSALLFVTVMNYFIGGRVLFGFLRDSWQAPLLFGFLFACALCVFEFCLVNFYGKALPGYRPDTVVYDSTFILGVRPRSTFSESGHFAFFLACVAPVLMAAYTERGRRNVVLLVLIAFIASAILLFSTTLFLVIFFWGLMYALIHRLYRRPWGFVLVFLMMGATVAFGSFFFELADALVLHKFRTYSFEDRQEKFAAVMDLMANAGPISVLFGYGMGSFMGLGMEDSISSYANFSRDTGLAGMALFLLAILPLELAFPKVARIWRRTFLFMGLGIVLYFAAVPNYYFPHLAFVLGLMSSMGSGRWEIDQGAKRTSGA